MFYFFSSVSGLCLGNEALNGEGPSREMATSGDNSISLSFYIPEDPEMEYGPEGDKIHLKGFLPSGKPGDPELPAYKFCFLVPEDVNQRSIKADILDGVWEEIPGVYEIRPVPPVIPLSEAPSSIIWEGKDPKNILKARDKTIYQKNAPFPEKPLGTPFSSKYRKWNLMYVTLTPVRYNPVEQRLFLLRSGIILITFELDKTGNRDDSWKSVAPDKEEKFWNRISPKIENSEDRDTFYSPEPLSLWKASRAVTADYVIITTSRIVSDSSWLGTFVTHKKNAPYSFTVSTIIEHSTTADDTHYLSGASAKDRAANIRSWLKNHQATIEYVLLIGDPHPTVFDTNRSIPMMLCYPDPLSHIVDNVPTDMCFAELSGDWDKDGDGYPGEWASGAEDFQSGGIDTDCELGVGRIPYYGSISDLDDILVKIISYENVTSVESWRKKGLIPAAILNHAPQDDNLDGDANDDGEREFSSSGSRTFSDSWGERMKTLFTGAGYTPYTLYEKMGVYTDGSAYPLTTCNKALTKANVKTEWKNLYGFVTWAGHGSQDGVTRVVWDDDDWTTPGHTAPDYITQYPPEITKTKYWESADCADLNDEYPSVVFEGSCNNAYPENSDNQAYSLLKNGAVAAFACTRVSYYESGATALTSWGDLFSHGYKTIDRMVSSADKTSDAINYTRSSFTIDRTSSWWNIIVLNLYGPPALTPIIISNWPNTPTNPGATNITANKIRWTWTDNATNEAGFRVYAGVGATAPATITQTTAANVQYWDHISLSTNTRYAMQVSAFNSFYESGKTPTITKYTAIEQVSGLNFFNITRNSIEVASINIPTNLTLGSSGLYFSNTTNATNSGWHQNNTPWASNSLMVNTQYTFSGKSRNGDGVETTPFSASKYTYIEQIAGLTLSSVGIDRISVQSTNTPSNLSAGSSGLKFYKSPGSSPCPWRQTNTAYTFMSLSPNTQYSFTGQSRNGEAVVTALSSSYSKYTLANTPTAPVITNPKVNSLDVTPGVADSNPSSTEYCIEISPSVGGGSWVQANGAVGVPCVYQSKAAWGTKTVTGLAKNTAYSFRSRARNGNMVYTSYCPWSSATKTLDTPPTAPSNPGTSYIGLFGITWTWQDNSTNENGFYIYAGQGATAPSTKVYIAPGNSTAWSQSCTKNTQYAFQVSAYNSGGESAKTSNLAKYTLIESVLGLTFSGVTNASINVKSSSTHSNLISGSSGLYFANTTMATNSGWQKNNNFWTSSGLSPNVQYTFTGQSRNGDGTVTPLYTDKKYTLCNIPNMPILSRITANSIDITIPGTDGNPAYTPYCIEVMQVPPGISGYVQTMGNIGPTPVYMTRAAWGTKCVGFFPASSTFRFFTYAQNGEGILAGPSPMAQATTLAASPPPAPPIFPGAIIITNGSIRWIWTDTSGDELGFAVYTGKNTYSPSDLNLTPPNTELLDQAGLSANTPYSMQAASWNNGGESAKTALLTRFTLANTPLAPIVNSPTSTSLNVAIDTADVNTTWTLYAIQISPTVGGFSWVQANGTMGASAVYQTASDWGAKTMTGLASLTLYTFTVKARNGDGTDTGMGSGGSLSTLASNAIPNGEPSSPGATNIATTSIRWTWNDNSSNETGFKVYAGAGATAPGTVTHTTGADAQYWDHSPLSTNAQYAMQVSATNTNGDTGKTANLTAYSAIESVSALTFSGATASSINVASTNVPSNLANGSSGLQFSIISPVPLNSPWQFSNTPYTFSGLSPNTQYTFLGKSRNGDALETAPFTGATKYTLANIPDAPTVSAPTQNTLDVAIGAYDSNPPETLYAIRISPAISGDSWVKEDGALGPNPVYQTSSAWGVKTVTGLSLFTSCTFTVTAMNQEAATSGPGAGTLASTLPTLPLAPSGPNASDITTDTIVWTWNDNSANETGFKVYAGTDVTPPSSMSFETGFDAVFWSNNGLLVNAQYSMQVASTNTAGDSGKTSSITRYSGIEPVTGLVFSGVTQSSISVASAATHTNLTAGSSGLYFANVTRGTNSEWKQNTTPWVSGGLSPNVPYTFIAKSGNGDGLETEEFIAVKCTLANTPSAPIVGLHTPSSVVVRINPSDGNPAPTLYSMKISPPVGGQIWIQADGAIGSSPVYRTSSSWGFATVTGLSDAVTYCLRVIAQNGDGINTSEGPGTTFNTLVEPPTYVNYNWNWYE